MSDADLHDRPHSEQAPASGAEGHEPIRRSYDRLAGVYDTRWRRYIEATARAAREAVALQGGEQVLDVACGTGALLEALGAEHADLRAVGLDLSLPMLSAARQRLGRVPLIQAEASRLPLFDRSFDLVFCVNSFHYFRRPLAALHEARRVLRPGGRLVLLDWCDDYLTCKLCSIWLRRTDPAFHRVYGLRECQAMLQQAGLRIHSANHFRVGLVWGIMQLVCERPA